MTSTPVQPVTDEQRIASLECQLVTMREALESINGIVCESKGVDGWHLNGDIALWTEFPNTIDAMDSALSASADYADKVVVDREDWKNLVHCYQSFFGADSLRSRQWGKR